MPNSTMTTPDIDTETGLQDSGNRAQTFLDWTRINSRAITIGALVVVVAAGIYAFMARSRAIESENAAKALMNAKQSMQSGNLPLAQSDLQKVFSRYGSTSSGVDAAAATTFETERAFLLAKAGRTWGDAGDTAKARAIWERILNDPKAKAVVGEARVRLGELTAQVAKK